MHKLITNTCTLLRKMCNFATNLMIKMFLLEFRISAVRLIQ
jgi:hypothetical protein